MCLACVTCEKPYESLKFTNFQGTVLLKDLQLAYLLCIRGELLTELRSGELPLLKPFLTVLGVAGLKCTCLQLYTQYVSIIKQYFI